MELKLTSEGHKPLLEFYDPKRKWGPQWGNMPQMMQDLVRQLEIASHAPVWVFTSHHELLLTDTKDTGTWRVTVVVKELEPTKEQFYRVTYALDPPWWHATGYAKSPAEAAGLVLEGLSRAAKGKRRNIAFNSEYT
jgi:hypothetical protein